MHRIIKKAKITFASTITSHFSGKITLHRKYAPGEYEEEVYYNIYVLSASEQSRRSTETLCRRNVLRTNTMLFHIQNMFHSEIRIKFANKNTALPQFCQFCDLAVFCTDPQAQDHSHTALEMGKNC